MRFACLASDFLFGIRIRAVAKTFATNEAGSLTIFSLFLFVLLLFISGMSVDMVHQEKRRVAMQNAVDSGILAASSLSQDIEAEVLVKDYVAKAGFNPETVTVTPLDVYSGNGAGLYSRSVSARTVASTDTMFMSMMGVSSLHSPVEGAAQESSESVEISLVLDISGSMNWASADTSKTKIEALKEAAKTFIDAVFEANDPDKVTISIVPYNQQVYMPASISSRLGLDDTTVNVSPVPNITGALRQYRVGNPLAPCVVFEENDFGTLSLGADTSFRRSSNFLADDYYWQLNAQIQQRYETPYEWARWCGTYFPPILPLSNDPDALKLHIDSLTATGATAINVGLNWGLGLLDSSFRQTVTDMVNNSVLPETARGRPFAYNSSGATKYVVLMTDGENTNQLDLKSAFRKGPTRVWYSESSASASKYDGYYVRMPNNTASQRWYRPRSPQVTTDDQYLSDTALPADAKQLDYHELYNRFGFDAAARFLFRYSDSAAYEAHKNVYEDVGGWDTANARLDRLCTLARTNDRVKVFTVAFEAPTGGQDVLSRCAYSPGYYFDVDGTDIKSAFRSIAGQIALLRLTE